MSKYLTLLVATLLPSITASWAETLLLMVKRDTRLPGVSPFRARPSELPENDHIDYDKAWISSPKEQEIVSPSFWTNTHTIPALTSALGDENAYSHPPISVTLKEGCDQPFIKLPAGMFTTREVRLVKGMFTAALVSQDGIKVADAGYLDYILL